MTNTANDMEPGDLEDEEAPAHRGLQDYLFASYQRRLVFPRAALVGAAAGATALLFRSVLAGGDRLRNSLLAWSHQFPWFGWVFPVAFAGLGAAVAVGMTRRWAPETSGSGIPHLEAVLHHLRQLNWRRVLPTKFIAGSIAIGVGLALGREGPTVQMGGAVGDAAAKWLRSSERERMLLISAGAGAGLAAAFNAPLSGLVFVLEEVRRDFQPIVFGAAFIAAIVADVVTRWLSGDLPVLGVLGYPAPPLYSLPLSAFLGVAAGYLGVAFNRSLLTTLRLYDRVPGRHRVAVAAVTGGIVGLAGWFSPLLVGSGHTLAAKTLRGELALGLIPVFLVVRLVLTTASYGTGAPGGIFAPLLVIGAMIGLACGQTAHIFLPQVVPIPAVFAVIGMAAYFTAVVRAPLTAVMLIAEMTGSYVLLLPLLAACFFAYAVAEHLRELPVYEALLERELSGGGTALQPKEPFVVEFAVDPGAPFDGLTVRELGLPPGCILVRCSDGKRDWIPTADTRLGAHVRITAMVDPETSDAVAILRQGCKA